MTRTGFPVADKRGRVRCYREQCGRLTDPATDRDDGHSKGRYSRLCRKCGQRTWFDKAEPA